MLKVLKSGLFTTVQDAGRFGYLNKGVPLAGYMDSVSAEKVNLLLENDAGSAVIEITMTGPTLEFGKSSYICMGGADISATLNNEPVNPYQVIKVEKGDILSYGKLKNGFRSYLAIRGGFRSPLVLGSRSFFTSITAEDHLADGAVIPYEGNGEFNPKIMEIKVDSFLQEKALEVTQGPEYDMLTDRQLEVLFYRDFHISNENNRMAYQLVEPLPGHEVSMLTSATLPGTVQFTPAGKLMVLMKDGQTTGGYPRILQLSDKSISILAQKKFKDVVSFTLC
ncbi:biotin-dependent carboxyltransferase family protein [Pricia sp. S334]|uniref:Biotin-dependent carboxyltransferase family protein n=1 Tax=Pricia mediterranea TaxID=3076079 RepID=A0ABU3L9S3_9FLAO|nr:biotin-dependent carboxyltransferase family protein [Pricia sp. S334]MDT7830489.1 biotin-dependent carboxyltransferase family protein [Pricia sp. S334]